MEVERKFLVIRENLPALPRGVHVWQGYLSCSPVVRVRIATLASSTHAFLTVKGPGLESREEFEYKIPVADAKAMLALCEKKIEKIRRRMGGWELDEFLGRLKGLWLAEYEFHGRSRKLSLPPWIGDEVTQCPQFANVELASRWDMSSAYLNRARRRISATF